MPITPSDERLMKRKRSSMLVTHHERGSWSGTRIGLITAGDDAQVRPGIQPKTSARPCWSPTMSRDRGQAPGLG
ncbi:hypothetical protein PoB_002137400 [Plakobranchus ocellatus]|uniref:Uncharacterized protein n=1 Tax=Plakobranchus ocellatus TaxID=259542 RepID=A0AAV3ZLW9_9GAST|nr:hypothetical protein PoB_002137400 [Plakobranchus ocellatus]